MADYYVNKNAQSTGEHEVHKAGCMWMPEAVNRVYLGDFATCHAAIAEAMLSYPNADGCYHCSPACHGK